MSEDVINRDQICSEFSEICWHDSKLIDLHVLKHSEKGSYDLQLDLDLIVNFSESKVDRSKQKAIFRDCRILQVQLDLLGITLCGGDIGSAYCYTDPIELQKETQKMVQTFDLPEGRNPLESCLGLLYK